MGGGMERIVGRRGKRWDVGVGREEGNGGMERMVGKSGRWVGWGRWDKGGGGEEGVV